MKLTEWMRRNRLTDGDIADKIARDISTISRVRRGVVKPTWATMIDIYTVTDGKVTPNAFLRLTEPPA